MWCFLLFARKNVKNTYEGELLLVNLQAETCNFTKSNTPPWVFLCLLNCTNGTKSRKASDISVYLSISVYMYIYIYLSIYFSLYLYLYLYLSIYKESKIILTMAENATAASEISYIFTVVDHLRTSLLLLLLSIISPNYLVIWKYILK